MKNYDLGHKKIKAFLALGAALLTWTGCTTKVGGVSPTDLAKDAEIKLTKFQSLDISSVPVGQNNEYKTNNKTLTFEGSCPKNAPTVRVKFNGEDAGVGAPCNNEVFVWSKADAVAMEEVVTAEFYVANVTGVPIEGVSLTKKVYVDATPPTAPTTLTINGTQVDVGGIYPVTTPDGSVTITGAIASNDADSYVSTDSAGSFTSKTTGGFTFTTTMTSGESRLVIFSFTDSLGNSSTAQVILSYNSSMVATAPQFIQPSATAQANAALTSGSHKMARATVDQYGTQTKSSGSYSMEIGTTNLLKQVQ